MDMDLILGDESPSSKTPAGIALTDADAAAAAAAAGDTYRGTVNDF